MRDPICIGLVGMGAAARGVISAIQRDNRYRFVAGADLDPKTRQRNEERHGIKTFESVEAMCKDGGVDAVYVATPNPFHAQHTIAAARAGKHVLVEKPMAMTVEECDAMIEAAQANGVKLMVAHTRSLNPPIRAMRQIVSGGTLGQPIQVTTLHYSPWLMRPRLPAEVDTALGGGVCYRQAPHQVDMVRLLAGGMATSVRATAGRWDPENATEGNYSAVIPFENGAVGTVIYNAYGYFDTSELTFGIGGEGHRREPGAGQRLREFVASGATKEDARSGEAFRVEDGGNEAEDERYQPFFGLTLVSCERGDLRQAPHGIRVYDREGIRDVPCPPWEGALVVELDDFYRAVAEGQPVLHDGAWGRATLEVCLAILESSRTGREVPLTRQVPSPF